MQSPNLYGEVIERHLILLEEVYLSFLCSDLTEEKDQEDAAYCEVDRYHIVEKVIALCTD